MIDKKKILERKKEDSPTDFILPLRRLFKQDLDAIILYGSWLRGQRNTLLDFYVLKRNRRNTENMISNLACRVLPPNVYVLKLDRKSGSDRMAKYSTMTLRSLERHVDKDFHPYFWARFCQPALLIWARDLATKDNVDRIFAHARYRMLKENLPLLMENFDSNVFWRQALTHTYSCELRSERPEKITEIVESNRLYLEKTLSEFRRKESFLIASASDAAASTNSVVRLLFRLRRRTQRNWGKLLSLTRLVKAAFTFNNALEYVLWKIERHSGIQETPSELQCRYPLLFAWPLLWKIYQKGGFK
jgi:hypothetical protein